MPKTTLTICFILIFFSINCLSQNNRNYLVKTDFQDKGNLRPVEMSMIGERKIQSKTLQEEKPFALSKNQLLDSILLSKYITDSEDWWTYKKKEYQYEDRGDTVTETWLVRNYPIDSFYNQKRYFYNFDQLGNKILEMGGSWNEEDSVFKTSYKHEWEYNSRGLKTYEANYYWDDVNEKWEGDKREEYLYDEGGNNTGYVYSEWFEVDEAFRNLYRQSWFFSGESLIRYSFSGWNNTDQVWRTWSSYENIYNDQGQKTLANNYTHDGSDSLLTSKTKWFYNPLGNPIRSESYSWDAISELFILVKKEEWQYNEAGENTIYKNYLLKQGDIWYIATQEEYSSNTDGAQTLIKTNRFHEEIGRELVHQKRIYGYDDRQNLTMEYYCDYAYTFLGEEISSMDTSGFKFESEYNPSDLKIVEYYVGWQPWNDPSVTYKDEFEYDANDNMVLHASFVTNEMGEYEGITKYLAQFNEYSNLESDMHYYWDANSKDWLLTNQSIRGNYYYMTLPVGLQDDITLKDVSIFPNPASDILIIEPREHTKVYQLFIYNTSGRIVMSEKFHSTAHINIGHLKKGIYYCIFREGNNPALVRKLIIH